MASLVSLIGIAIVAGCVVLVYQAASHRNRKYPPGPKGWPLIGNLLDLPQKNNWEAFTVMRKDYGDMMFMKVLGLPILVVSSLEITQELLDKKGTIYSDRPKMTMAGELCGFNAIMPIRPYGDPRIRTERRFMHQLMGTRGALEKLEDVQEEEGARLLLRLLQDPRSENLEAHIRKWAGAIFLKLAYGYTPSENDDPFVKQAEVVVSRFSQVTRAGAFIVDTIPALKYLPSWMPGTGFKHVAKIAKMELQKMFNVPMEWAKRHKEEALRIPNLVTMHERSDMSDEEYYILKQAAGTLYGGGADTAVSAMYCLFLLYAKHPDVQAKAQAEADRVVGSGRLPQMKDRSQMPYTDAIVKELLRWNVIVPLCLPHMLNKDDFHRGYFIPKGTLVLPNVYFMLQNEATYENPTQFNPERFLSTNEKPAELDPRTMAFGFGRRICPGQYVAEDSIFMLCAMVASVFNVSKAVENGVPVEPVYEAVGATITHPKRFKCSITPRSEHTAQLVRSTVEEYQHKADLSTPSTHTK